MQNFDPQNALMEIKKEFGDHGGVVPSITRSSTFFVKEPQTLPQIFQGIRGPEKGGYYLYSRHFNPTLVALQNYLAALENTESALCTASGMSAISCSLLQICKQGDHIVSSNTVYGGTHALLGEVFPEMGVQCTFVDPTDVDAFEAAIKPETKVIYTETVGNPTLKISDIPRLSKLAHSRGITLVVDNTFSPVVTTPSILGADIVVNSLTKFINGGSDLIAGAICARKDFIDELMNIHRGRAMLLGPTLDPQVAFDLIQRIPHLPLRMREHSARALSIAKRLEELGASVIYPGLSSHPQHELMTSLINQDYGYGGMLALDCKTKEKAEELMSVLQNKENFGLIAVSLGYYETLMSCSGSSTSSEISPEEQSKIGLSPGLLRLSIGYTGSLDSRLEQIERGVKSVGLV
ncbi:aminotransferase class I/II-fold pyridoxal phosphate-dependent enzyme [bacterium]|nr:aminotransferase class I/II-fold pyridoxal phosphate-dependent enzyme [bacterium]